jgi:hypothetical protein
MVVRKLCHVGETSLALGKVGNPGTERSIELTAMSGDWQVGLEVAERSYFGEFLQSLILRRFLDVVDDERGDQAFGRFEFETELFLDGGEDGGQRLLVRAEWQHLSVDDWAHCFGWGAAQGEVVLAGEPRLVDDLTSDIYSRQRHRQRCHGHALAGESNQSTCAGG